MNDNFLYDVNFIDECEKAGCMVNSYFGAYLYQQRLTTTKPFDPELFIAYSKKNQVLQELLVKYHKVGTTDGADSRKVVTQILEIYENIFKLMSGGKVQKSYAEKLKECKELATVLKKDKTWSKLTGHGKYYRLQNIMEERIKNKTPLEFKCVVFPKYMRENEILIPHGLLEGVKFIKWCKARKWGENTYAEFGSELDGILWTLGHNWGAGGKHYTKLEHHNSCPHQVYDIEIFVNINPKEI